MPCATRWAQDAMEPRHLRGLEVGCGKHKQCVWLPMPHFKEAWCNGVDFVYSIDYEGLVDSGEIVPHRDVAERKPGAIRLPSPQEGRVCHVLLMVGVWDFRRRCRQPTQHAPP